MFVDLVHRLSYQAKLGHRAVFLNKPGVRCAPRRAEFGHPSGGRLDRGRNRGAQVTRRGQEGFAGDPKAQRIGCATVAQCGIEGFARPDRETVRAVQIIETNVEGRTHRRGDNVIGRIAHIDGGELQS